MPDIFYDAFHCVFYGDRMITRTSLASLIVLAGTLLAPVSSLAQTSPTEFDKSVDQAVGDHVKVHQILTELQQAVSKHDATTVASLVHYPIKVNPGKHPFVVKNEKAFVKDYDRIITHDITAAIFKQKYENLFVNSQGAMIGDGEVWITSYCLDKGCTKSDIKIGTIQDTTNLKP
jgi:hypothetical protein